MEIVLIAAVAKNGVIGRGGTLPWHLPEDLAHFKETTMGSPVIMGRVAFEDVLETLGEPLPGRTNIVLSRDEAALPAGVIHAGNLDESIAAAKQTGSNEIFVAGGATIYEQFLPLADRMILTELHESYCGDTRFPSWDRDAWRVRSSESREDFDIVEYERAAPNSGGDRIT